MKMMKIAGGSLIPNHRIANGIHAIGDSERKKLTHGRSAARVDSERPTATPSGIANTVADTNPNDTRYSDAIVSSSNRPDEISSPNATATSSGDGTVPTGKAPAACAIHQIPSKASPVRTGRTRRSNPGRIVAHGPTP